MLRDNNMPSARGQKCKKVHGGGTFHRKTSINKGFSLVELIVVIAILVVFAAILVPSLLQYTENSRAQKDESAMDEVVNAIQLAVADEKCFDEALKYSCTNNYLTYSDSSGNYGQQINDGEFWAPDGLGRATTITFNPEFGSNNEIVYNLSKGIVNDMTYGNGSVAQGRVMEGALIENNQCYLDKMTYLYNMIRQTVGNNIVTTSQTYRNSSFTIFIRFAQKDGITVADVNGSFNGTNVYDGAVASKGSGTSSYDNSGDAIISVTTPGITDAVYNTTDLQGGGSFSFTIDYKQPTLIETAGLYKTGTDELIYSWQELIDKQYISITNGELAKKNSAYKLTGDLVVDNSVVSIGNSAFQSTPITGIQIPNTVTNIGQNAFYNCGQLTNVIIPDSVTSIGIDAFAWSGIREINIPKSVSFIGGSAFAACRNLTSIAVDADNSNYSSISGNLYNKDATTLIQVAARKTTFCLPSKVTRIENKAFWCCKYIQSIEVESRNQTFVSIDGVLYKKGAQQLVICPAGRVDELHVPETVTWINSHALAYVNFNNIYLPRSLNGIGYYNFYGTKITNIYYDETIEQWNNILIQEIETENSDLITANIYFNS